MVKQSAYEKLKQRVKELEKELAERKHTEETPREDASVLGNILEKAADGISVCHNIPEEPFVKFTHWNPPMIAITGYTMEEINQLGWYQTMYPDSEVQRRATERMARMRTGEDILAEEWTITTKHGERKFLSISTSIIKEDDGRVHVLAIMQDITGRKQVEEALQKSEQRFRSLVETTSDWVWEVDKNGFYTYASPKVKDLLGYGPEEIIGKKPFDLMPLDEAGRIAKLFRGIVKSRKPFTRLENTNAHKDGHLVVLESSGVPIFEKDGNFTGYRGIDRDITERKRTEQALSESENTHRIVAQFTYDWEYWRGPDGRFLYISPSCERITGYTREEFIEDLELYSRILHPDDREHVMSHLREAQFRPEPCELEFRIVRRDGQERWIGHACNLVLDANGQSLGRRASNRDITKRKHAEQVLQDRTFELQQLTDKLEQRVRERTEDLATANETLRQLSIKLLLAQEEERKRIAGEIHDSLGGCLSGIKFTVEDTLRRIGQTPSAATESLNTIIPMIQEGVDECQRIQMDLRPPMLDDLGLLPTLSWFFRRYQAIYSEIQIEQEIGIEEGEIPKALKIVIYRVTQEGMNNIAKHSKANRARLSLQKLDDKVQLLLQDNGRGFDQEKAHFQESSRRGLGLSSMRERVELSRGCFAIESTEGKGTVIRASWPL